MDISQLLVTIIKILLLNTSAEEILIRGREGERVECRTG